MRRKNVILVIFFLIFFIGFEFSDMTLAFINLPSGYTYYVTSFDKKLPKNVTLIIPTCSLNGDIAEIKPLREGNISLVDTQYGKMIKIEAEEVDHITITSFISSEKTIDIINENITLSPILERKLLSKTENKEELSMVYRVKIPVYAEFEGDSTIYLRLDVESGFKALPFFYTFTIPWEPRYGWKPYAGHKYLEVKITKKGWQLAEGEERVRLIFAV
jgi:hypothetical protein